jgi:hypothetical protein
MKIFNSFIFNVLKRFPFLVIFVVGLCCGKPGLAQQVTVTCNPSLTPYWTGTCSNTSYIENSYIYAIGNNGQRGFAMFDISGIPGSAIINTVKIHFFAEVSAGSPYYLVTKLTHHPVETLASVVYSEIGLASTSINANTYYKYSTSTPPTNVWRELTLNNYCKNDLQNVISNTQQPWFGVGFYEYENTSIYWMKLHGWFQPNIPYLEVTYTPNFSLDIGLENILPPSPICAGQYPIRFVVKNFGTTNLTSATINWTINGSGQTPVTWSKPSGLAQGQTDTITLLNYNFVTGPVTIAGTLSNPNGLPDLYTINNTKSKTIQINALPSITTQPMDVSASIGGNAMIGVTATGAGLIYQWQISTNNGVNWANILNQAPYSQVSSNMLNITNVNFSMAGYRYRCAINGICGTGLISNVSTLIVGSPIALTAGASYACPGATALVPINIQNMVNIMSFTITLNYNASNITYLSATNLSSSLAGGSWNVQVAGGKIKMIWSGPSPASIASGKICDLQLTFISGTNNLIWDTLTPGNCSFLTFTGIEFPAHFINGPFSNANGSIAQQPYPVVTGVNETAKFYVGCTGAPLYQWQRSINGGTTWVNLSNGILPGGSIANCTGVNADTLKIFDCQTFLHQNRFRCIVGYCSANITSGVAELTVFQKVITRLDSVWKCVGDLVIVPVKVWNFTDIGSVSLRIEYSASSLTYQGYQNANPTLWPIVNSPYAGMVAIAATVVPPNPPMQIPSGGHILELKFLYTGGCGYMRFDTLTQLGQMCIYSDTVGNPLPDKFYSGGVCNGAVTITAQPTPVTIFPGDNTSFNVTATGKGTLNYQWQLSTNGGTSWTNLANTINYSGCTTPSLVLSAIPQTYNTYKYRCIITGLCPSTISNAVILTVLPTPIYVTPGTIAGNTGTANNPFCELDDVIIPLKILNANNIGSISLILQYDNTKLLFDSYLNACTELDGGTLMCFQTNSNEVTISWFANFGSVNIPNGTVLELKFINIGGSFAGSPLTWKTTPIQLCFIYSGSGTVLTSVLNPGLVSVLSLPTTFNVLPAGVNEGHFCSGGIGVPIGIEFSQPGVNYKLYLDNTTEIGSWPGSGQGFFFGTYTQPGIYSVRAYNGTSPCWNLMVGQVEVVADAPPQSYSITGGGSFCSGSGGLPINLSNSQSGVQYQLRRDGTATGPPLDGTGSALTFPAQAIAGTYTAEAFNQTNGTCPTTMAGSAVLVMVTAPGATGAITGQSVLCQGATNVVYVIPPVAGASTYNWTVPNGGTIVGGGTTSITVNYSNIAVSGNVSVYAENSCGIGPVSNLAVTVNPLPNTNLILGQPTPVCIETTPFLLTGGTPSGGTYSGGIYITGGNTFNPALASLVALNPIHYTYADPVTSCSKSATINVTIAIKPKIQGSVSYDNAGLTPMGNVSMVLKTGAIVIDNQVTALGSGSYTFKCLSSGTYTIEASTTRPWTNQAVNATDALIIAQFGVGTTGLTALRQKAADVNSSGFINATDAMIVMKKFVNPTMAFPSPTPNWVWNIANPYTVASSSLSLPFKGLMTGDADGSWVPTATTKTSPLEQEYSGEIHLSNSGDFEIPVYTKQAMEAAAISLALNYPEEIFEIYGVNTSLKNLEWNVSGGQFRMAWYCLDPVKFAEHEPLIFLKVRLRQGQKFHGDFTLDISSESLISDIRGKTIENMVLMIPVLKVNATDDPGEQESGYALGLNSPNPFDDLTSFDFSIPEEGDVIVSIYDIHGRKISILRKEHLAVGTYHQTFNREELTPGAYLYKLEVQNRHHFVKTRMMIIR